MSEYQKIGKNNGRKTCYSIQIPQYYWYYGRIKREYKKDLQPRLFILHIFLRPLLSSDIASTYADST